MNSISELLPYLLQGYKWIGLAFAAITFLSTEGTRRERALEALVSGVAWPYVLYKHLKGKPSQ